MKFLSKIISFIFIALAISACANTGHDTRQKVADLLAVRNGFQSKIMKGGQFWLQTYQRISNPNLPYVFYIEGDGFAFRDRFTISDDPTPKRSMVFALATQDYRSNVVYIARPCQYVAGMDMHCNSAYWTEKRMASEVVDSINEAIKTISHGQPFHLVGYSGGGGIAVLIADRNKKVRSILTIAANLDPKLFNEYHHVKPMLGSLNPIDVAHSTRNVPQLHISGGKDDIVKPFITDKYVKAANSPCVKQEILPNVSHDKGWDKAWKYILGSPVTCAKP